MANSKVILGLCVAVLGLSACGNDDLVCDKQATAVTTTKVFNDVIKTQCLACHGTPGEANARKAGDYTDLAKFTATVTDTASTGYAPLKMVDSSGDLSNSTVWLKLLGDNTAGKGGVKTGPRMPEGGMLTATQMKLVKDWICTGAKAQ